MCLTERTLNFGKSCREQNGTVNCQLRSDVATLIVSRFLVFTLVILILRKLFDHELPVAILAKSKLVAFHLVVVVLRCVIRLCGLLRAGLLRLLVCNRYNRFPIEELIYFFVFSPSFW